MGDLNKEIKNRITDQTMPPYLYTYPTKKSYRPFTDWKKACESWQDVTGPITIYFHLPFCEMKCSFCDLFTVTNQPRGIIEKYVDCVVKEVDLMVDYLRIDEIEVGSIYLGGGTPTLLTKSQLAKILGKLRSTFIIKEGSELSIEGAPNSFNDEKLEILKELGFNRISMGIQTFDSTELKAMGRHYDAKLGEEIARKAIACGIPNVNLDLIYGIPGQDYEGWKLNLQKAMDIAPATLTMYPLVVRDRTVYGKQKNKGMRDDFVGTQLRYQWYDFTHDQLRKNGYNQHTLVTYSKAAGGCQHEENEFQGAPTLSFGSGSRKYAPKMHYVDEDYVHRLSNLKTMMEYMESVELGEIPVKSAIELTTQEQILRFVILGLLSAGVYKDVYRKRFKE